MGEIADSHIRNFASGRWGSRIPEPREYPKTTKAAIAGRRFAIVEVTGFKTVRSIGSKLVVTDNEAMPESYWVWQSKQVTGIRKDQCTVLEADLAIDDALAKTGRKLYFNDTQDI